jgi:hypothetical protein
MKSTLTFSILFLLMSMIFVTDVMGQTPPPPGNEEGNRIKTQQFDIQIYPNPASEWISISSNLDDAQEVNVYVSSISGQIMIYDLISSKGGVSQVDVSNLPPGNYIIEVRFENNSIRKRFVKSN